MTPDLILLKISSRMKEIYVRFRTYVVDGGFVESLQQFKTIIDQMDGAAITDRMGRYLYANKGWERHMGMRFEQVAGKSALEVVSKSRLMEAMSTGKAICGTPIHQDGHEMFSNYHPIFEHGEVIGCFIQIIFGNIEEAILFSDTVLHTQSELAYYKNELHQMKRKTFQYSVDNIVGNSDAVEKMKHQIYLAARSVSTVLIIGETGSGKELVAHSIHHLSQRKDHPFIKINCAAIPPELAESEFFGYEYGAFTGAKRGGKEGLFETANHGSLFLDEINQMSYFIQPKILRVLQEREVTRVGGTASTPVNVRLIAACNEPLEQLISEGKFRKDLYYRLNVVRIYVPPLRERLEDIPLLVADIISRLNFQLGTRVEGVSQEVIDRFQDHDWPGNIRELQNVVEQAMNVKGSGVLDYHCFEHDRQSDNWGRSHQSGVGNLEQQKRELERAMITEAYQRFRGNKKKTADYLGISRPMLYQRLRDFGLPV